MLASVRETCEEKTATSAKWLTYSALVSLLNLTECNWECCSCGLKALGVSGLVIIRGVSLPVTQYKLNKERKRVLRKVQIIVMKGFKKHHCFHVFCLHHYCPVLIAVEMPKQTSQKILEQVMQYFLELTYWQWSLEKNLSHTTDFFLCITKFTPFINKPPNHTYSLESQTRLRFPTLS